MGKLQRRLESGLTLWVRQLAWYHTAPKPDPAREGDRGKTPPPKPTRIEQLKRDKIEPRMPPNPAPHITDRLIEIGITEAAGMGAVPLTWREINAWRESVRLTIEPWEMRLLRRLSAAYLAESRKAESETCPSPWRAEPTPREREAELAGLRGLLG